MTITLPEQPIPDERLTPGKVAEILLTAAALLELYGLHVGDWWEHHRPSFGAWVPDAGLRLCAVGAIAVAAGYRTTHGAERHMIDLHAADEGRDEPEPHPAVVALLRWHGWKHPDEIYPWSDAAAKDEEPERVYETFRAIAARLTQDGAA